jgi:macrolide-specific efflux system membrane fusion protein
MKNKKWLWIIGVTILCTGLASYILSKPKSTKASFKEAKVIRGPFQETVLSTGTVAPENRLAIRPPIGGRVEKILVKEGDSIRAGQVLAWVSTTERAALLDSARAEGEKELAQWEQYYKPTPVYAPIRGMLILKSVEPGQSFNAGDSILTMSDRLTIKAQVDETSISKVSLGQKAEVILDAYPNEKLEASVVHRGFDSRIVNSVTSYIVDVLPKTVPEHMLSGMTANVKFILSEKKETLLIPNEAILSVKGEPCVKIGAEVNPDPNQCTPVKLGPSNEQVTVIESGLTEGQTLWVQELMPLDSKSKKMPSNPFSPMGSGRGRH